MVQIRTSTSFAFVVHVIERRIGFVVQRAVAAILANALRVADLGVHRFLRVAYVHHEDSLRVTVHFVKAKSGKLKYSISLVQKRKPPPLPRAVSSLPLRFEFGHLFGHRPQSAVEFSHRHQLT